MPIASAQPTLTLPASALDPDGGDVLALAGRPRNPRRNHDGRLALDYEMRPSGSPRDWAQNGLFVIDYINQAARRARDTNLNPPSLVDLKISRALFNPVFRRLPTVHELLTSLWERGAQDRVGVILGARRGRGRPTDVAEDGAIYVAIDELMSEGMSADRAIAKLKALGTPYHLPSVDTLANKFSARGEIYLRAGLPYFVPAEKLTARSWIPPGSTEPDWNVYALRMGEESEP
jgi:hypothetical protein